MELNEILNEIKNACQKLYQQKKYLIDKRSNELTIASHIASYLRSELKEWDIDTDYRREGLNKKKKKDLDGNIIIPDIVIHKHGPEGPNLAAIEIKGHWNKEDRGIDVAKLKSIQAKHEYIFLFRIELLNNAAEIIQVESEF